MEVTEKEVCNKINWGGGGGESKISLWISELARTMSCTPEALSLLSGLDWD